LAPSQKVQDCSSLRHWGVPFSLGRDTDRRQLRPQIPYCHKLRKACQSLSQRRDTEYESGDGEGQIL
jgi:hypothetical protein